MASINNVAIKSLRSFTGREGVFLQGNVYLEGKKLGFWSQDGHGGPDMFGFDEGILSQALNDYKDGFPSTYRYKDLCDLPDVLLDEVAHLTNIEKEIRNKGFKKGFKVAILVEDGIYESYLFVAQDEPDSVLLSKYADDINNMKAQMGKYSRVKTHIFRPGQFEFTVDGNNPAPDLFMD